MIDIPEILKPYFEKPVAIFGNGISGRSVACLLDYLKINYIIYDKVAGGGVCSDFSEEECKKHSLVVFSPGFPEDHIWIERSWRNGCYLLGELDFASIFWKGKIIAITGTNGKSTLTQLLTNALVESGLNAIACGNIGNALSAQYKYFSDKEAIAVCEVSSFQAEGLKYFSPDALLWTNFDEDHLDRYPNLKEYFNAKWSLVNRLKTNILLIDETVKQFALSNSFSFPMEPIIVDEQVQYNERITKGVFSKSPQTKNYLLATTYWRLSGYDIKILKKVALSFKALPHRLTKVDTVNGITFWNDSKGTNFLATLEALKQFKKRVLWIGGGKYKGGDLETFVYKISPYIQEAFLIGQTAQALAFFFKINDVKARIYASLEDAVEAASAFESGLSSAVQDIVFSPGFSSFDMFNNAEERGNFFEKKVLELKRK